MLKLSLFIAAVLAVCHAKNSYYVYTRTKPQQPTEIFATEESVIKFSLNFRPKTAIIVHGHLGSGNSSLNPTVKDTLLKTEDVAVIVVDWSKEASGWYIDAVEAVPNVAADLAELIRLLERFNRISLDRLHLVGFDLGAHIVGFAGRQLNGQVARITGLDPNGVHWGSKSGRLRASDAVYVEVIHTDGIGFLLNHGIGKAIGDVDFFVNGGGNQPGCISISSSCSHNRAWELFAVSLESDHLVGNFCANTIQLKNDRCRGPALVLGNNDLDKHGSGRYRVNTKRKYPF